MKEARVRVKRKEKRITDKKTVFKTEEQNLEFGDLHLTFYLPAKLENVIR